MDITFYGAAREVTGSMHMIASGSDRILLDSGMFQGRRKEAEEKNNTLSFDPGTITNILLSRVLGVGFQASSWLSAGCL